ncbi:BAG family molecular chaperone regulator 2 isoform X2 [Galendromus occidentalis]|uniref:BAG family molecular chaperone regulator 2 isoform X2 n=1 Tax=Galendromus occidentalis TaxID=34638 RepID=A0AAJ7P9Y6_9ACAR|nr:BAG family molecular chaperone regulator 2 isoform X2 [Galendromus occidentalis]
MNRFPRPPRWRERHFSDYANPSDSEMCFELPEAEQEELMLIRTRLLSRVTTVDVTVLTPRTEQQTSALVAVTEILDKLLTRFQKEECKHECERYLNSCLSDPTGPIDEKFQSKVVECTADDQKKIKKKLQAMLRQLEMEQDEQKQQEENLPNGDAHSHNNI